MKDYIVRATAGDGQIRAFACNNRKSGGRGKKET